MDDERGVSLGIEGTLVGIRCCMVEETTVGAIVTISYQ